MTQHNKTQSSWRNLIIKMTPIMSNITCSTLISHPWTTDGLITPSGRYLSPENAIASLTKRLTSIGGTADIVAFLVCAPTITNFIERLSQFSSVLPIPEIARITRIAKTQQHLPISKMQIPAKIQGGLPPIQTLSLKTLRSLQTASTVSAIAAPNSSSLSQLTHDMELFAQQRADILKEISNEKEILLQAKCNIWGFISSGDIRTSCLAMQKQIPYKDSIFSIVILFIGDDLSSLRTLCYEPNHHSCA
ncbi:hypothetical protein GBN32_00215 [Plesiomonas shigelloides]|uniref:hypothetical protein n=1 Tax=Plesiomonas shigelloides TaxID=703 RepID=UPI00126169BF|nr:hypothetical protein [Plesiomonas shigelloides]KAB7715697.1 hypothetical protein GBN32_00215 [Plesiomonas shigelloides]